VVTAKAGVDAGPWEGPASDCADRSEGDGQNLKRLSG
jgi:hypothetical protein